MILRKLEGRTGTGPIDSLVMYEIDIECPCCGYWDVWHIPEQKGACHSGQFENSTIEYFWCEACDAYLTDKEPVK